MNHEAAIGLHRAAAQYLAFDQGSFLDRDLELFENFTHPHGQWFVEDQPESALGAVVADEGNGLGTVWEKFGSPIIGMAISSWFVR
jgi:hypothetical protein